MPETPERSYNKEKEIKPFFFVYRENDLFREYVPLMIALLKERGYQVNIKSFPAGTPEEEIKSWYIAHQPELQAADIFADSTTERSSEYQLKTKINLDDLMNEATVESITGDVTSVEQLSSELYKNRKNPEKQQEKKQEYLSALGEMYKRILSSIPEEQRQKMEVIILKGLFRRDSAFPSLIAHEHFGWKNFEELERETNDFADRLKEWFREVGIFNITIFSTGAEIPPEIIRKLTKGEAYIIFDRHTSTSDSNLTQKGVEDMRAFWGANAIHSGIIAEKSALQTPIETFYYDVQEKIGIAVDPRAVEEVMRKRLLGELTKKEEDS